MSKDNELYINKINKIIRNNESIYYSNKQNYNKEIKNKDVYKKINMIFKSKNFVYQAVVLITTKDGEFTKKIIARNNKYLITNENEMIPIQDIVDINLK